MTENYLDEMIVELRRIANALDRTANALAGMNALTTITQRQQQRHSATVETTHSLVADYDAAVAALKAMPDDIPAPAPKGKPATKEQVVSELNAFSRAKGVAAAKKVLQGYGESLGVVPEEKYADLIAELRVLS